MSMEFSRLYLIVDQVENQHVTHMHQFLKAFESLIAMSLLWYFAGAYLALWYFFVQNLFANDLILISIETVTRKIVITSFLSKINVVVVVLSLNG